MIPRFKADFGAAELRAAFSPLLGREKEIAKFELDFAGLFDQRYAIAMPYGRTGLIMLLKAFGFEGDEVLCPSYTCLVVPEAIEKSGNQTVFVDCSAADYNVDFDLLEEAVGPRTSAFVATSIFGHPINAKKLASFRARHPQIKVIQDCAHSFAAEWDGESVVAMGDAAFFGLNISKTMSSIFGGMVTTNDVALAERLRVLCAEQIRAPGVKKNLARRAYVLAAWTAFTRPVYGAVNWLERIGALSKFTTYYSEETVMMPSDYLDGMTAIEARVGQLQCGKYKDIVAHRRAVAKIYFDALSSTEAEDFILPPNLAGASYSHFAVRTKFAPALIEDLRKNGVQLGHLIEYHCPDHQAFNARRCIGPRHAAEWPGTMINLPLQRDLKPAEALEIAELITGSLLRLRAEAPRTCVLK